MKDKAATYGVHASLIEDVFLPVRGNQETMMDLSTMEFDDN